MSTELEFPETLQAAMVYFSDEDRAFEFVKRFRWLNGEAQCPKCNSKDAYFLPSGKVWKCKGCSYKYSLKIGTIFEDSPVSLGKWMCAFWLNVNCKNGISSYKLSRDLKTTQRTAWFMLQRIRLALQNGSIVKMGGTVEADETFIGGRARNMHKSKRKYSGGGPNQMTAVQGLLERHSGKKGKASRVVLNVLNNTKRPAMQENVRKYVLKGAEVFTDAHHSYNGLGREYVHEVVDHAEEYVRGKVHTNGLENFWALLKRCIKGTHVNVEPFHLFRYLDDEAFRFNERKDTDQGRFLKAVWGIIGKRLTWAKLTAENDGLPATA